MFTSHFTAQILAFALCVLPVSSPLESSATDTQKSALAESQQLGTLAVDDYTALVLFQDPADDGKSYRVAVAIPKPWETPAIKTARIDVWLLARGGQALEVTQRPTGDVLIEAGSAGATANAIYFFARSVEPGDLAAVVVSIDGQPTAFKLSR